MPINHEFWVASRVDIDDLEKVYHRAPSAVVSDDLLRSMESTLRWIPQYLPKGGAESGLNLESVTLLDPEGVLLLEKLVTAWMHLYQLAPETIAIDTGYNLRGADFYYVHLPRSEILEQLSMLRSAALKAIQDKGFIIHGGL